MSAENSASDQNQSASGHQSNRSGFSRRYGEKVEINKVGPRRATKTCQA